MSKLIIQTLTWNKLDMLSVVMASIEPALKGIDYSWHIKDNGSIDRTVEEASKWNNVVMHAYPNNRQSFAQGMNYIFQAANPSDDDLILLLNNDVIFNDDNSIKQMINCLKDDVGVVGARLTYTGTNKLQHAGVVFHESNLLPIHFKAHQEVDNDSKKNREFQAVTGAVLLTKAKYYREVCKTNPSKIDGMDETYQWMYEDIDLCLSIKRLGKKIIYCGETEISHRESATLKENPVNRLFLNDNITHFRKRHHGHYVADAAMYRNNPKLGL